MSVDAEARISKPCLCFLTLPFPPHFEMSDDIYGLPFDTVLELRRCRSVMDVFRENFGQNM